ncbi:MAG: four helix bundle protein [Phycisphaerales bacterium]
MATYSRFEDLPVWQAAIELGLGIFALTEDPQLARRGDLRSQLRRAALSVSNNVAEGFERGTTNELLSFLYIARGSSAETRSMLCFAEQLPGVGHLKSQISNLKSQSERCSRQLRGWADHLQNTDIEGQRHLNDESRERRRRAARRTAVLDEIDRAASRSRDGARDG